MKKEKEKKKQQCTEVKNNPRERLSSLARMALQGHSQDVIDPGTDYCGFQERVKGQDNFSSTKQNMFPVLSGTFQFVLQ